MLELGEEKDPLGSMLSRRQLQGFVRLRLLDNTNQTKE